MWSSFTKDEKKLFIFFLVMLGIGSLALNYVDQRRKTEIFTARGDNPRTQEGVLRQQSPSSHASNSSRGPLDLNTASEAQLIKLPGIGKVRAQAIVAYRESHGPFASVDDLAKVHGIGLATVRRLDGYVTVTQKTDATTSAIHKGSTIGFTPTPMNQSFPTKNTFPSTPISTPATPQSNSLVLDLNTASVSELAGLEQIGPTLAQRIVDYRTRNGRFSRIEDLDKVPGIGKKRIELNRHRLTIR